MSSNGPSFSSNNPFRRKLNPSSNQAAESNANSGVDWPHVSPTSASSFTTFKSAVPEDERRYEEAQPVQQIPRKIVKKVRVQSPPPSPSWRDESVPVTRRSSKNDDSDSDSESNSDDSDGSQEQADDPFEAGAVEIDNDSSVDSSLSKIPQNPFAGAAGSGKENDQTHETNASPRNPSRGTLDVNSFKRLLLTGNADLPDSEQISRPVDADSIPQQFPTDALQKAPNTSHAISESEASDERKIPQSPYSATTISSPSIRKKPPPPSSRYGKLIKIELGAESETVTTKPSGVPVPPLVLDTMPRKLSDASAAQSPRQSPREASNTNKPLPAPPVRSSIDEDSESPFDREAAGKLPEPFSQAHLQSPASEPTARSRSASQTSTQSSKPMAPPPRRKGKVDGKPPSVHSYSTYPDEDLPRSSIDSSRSLTEALRIGINSAAYAPAPPPPRRLAHTTRQASSVPITCYAGPFPATSSVPGEKERTLSASSDTAPGNRNSLAPAPSITNGMANKSRPPPPPPPSRNKSVRRPASVRSMEISNGAPPARKVSREKDGPAPPPPPPPPPRARTSRIYSDPPLSEEGRRGSVTSTRSTGTESVVGNVAEGTQGQEILADLDALRREVDEFMKKARGD